MPTAPTRERRTNMTDLRPPEWYAVIRHPDYETDTICISGPSRTQFIDIDLGASFDERPNSQEEAEEFLQDLEQQAENAPDDAKAWVAEYCEELVKEWGDLT